MRSHFPWRRYFYFLIFLCVLIGGAVLWFYHWRAERLDIREVEQMKERSTVYDMDGKVWSRLQGENRVTVKLEEVSHYFIASLLAREDTRFFKHGGVDFLSLGRAVVRSVQGKQQGGSTLTQQLARNSFEALGQRKSLDRKLLEVFVARRIEKAFKKDQILEMYMNRIYFGSGVYGIEMASKAYFGKSAADLTLSEAAMIAGIIRAPTKASPFTNLKRAKAERDMVLDRLKTSDCEWVREKYKVTEEQLLIAHKQELRPVVGRKRSTQENYAMDYVMRELDTLLNDDQKDDGGLKIYTTIDPQLQDEAQKSLDRVLTKVEQRAGYPHPRKSDFSEQARKEELPTEYLQGAVVAVDNRSGGIRALVGGRDYRESKFNRAIDAKRTIGSTFKPFVYAAGFARGLQPDTDISDGPLLPGEIANGGGWHPENSDGKFQGMLSLEEGLIHSRNTMTVRVGNRAGIENVAGVARQVGLPEMPLNAQSYIGNFGATPKELTVAYTVLANGGLKRQSYIIERIDSADGDTLYRAGHNSVKALDPGVCNTTTNVLAQVLDHGTAAAAKSLGWTKPAAGKTGTTNDYFDAWFAGYTSSLTCCVWVGLDKPATIVPKGYGAALALPVWVDVMKRATADKYPANSLERSGAALIRKEEVLTHDEPVTKKPESKPEGGVLRSFRKFFGGQ